MQLLILILKIISIPLIIIIGESHLNKNTKTITLLLLAFLFNSFLVSTIWLLMFVISVFKNSYLFILSIFIIGFLVLSYLITINMYIKRKIDINITLYIVLCVTGLLTGLFI